MVLFSLYSAERAVVMTTLVDDVIIHKQIPAAFQSAAIQGFFLEGFSWLRFSIEVLFSFLLVDTPFEKKNKAANQVEPSGCHTPASYFIYFIHFFSPVLPSTSAHHLFSRLCFQVRAECVGVCVCGIGEMYQPRATRTLYCSM